MIFIKGTTCRGREKGHEKTSRPSPIYRHYSLIRRRLGGEAEERILEFALLILALSASLSLPDDSLHGEGTI